MENRERRAPREVRIRRAIVILSSWQSALGAVIIAMSFTVFACSSSERIRNACPYWAGFTVLFTGSVGFLTWKQLSIISIGIYTFLSAVSVIVHLVGTVLTGDCAGFLRSLKFCVEIEFEHACGCCITNDSCKLPYKFPSVRDCSILSGLLKDLMYGLCAINVLCCLICLGITVMGCTLVAQYSHYTQTFGIRWHRHPGQPSQDRGYNWLAFPSDPSDFIPPCAPPIYCPGQNNPEDAEASNGRPPTVFDPVDFPPPYSSREPSLSGRQPRYCLDTGYSIVSSGQSSVERDIELEAEYQDYELNRQESGSRSQGDCEDSSMSFGCIPECSNSQGLGSSTDLPGHIDTSSGAPGVNGSECSTPIDNAGRIDLYHQVKPSSRDTVMDTNDCVCSSLSSMVTNTHRFIDQPRRHSYPYNHHFSQPDEVYSPHDEVYQGVIAHNVNPWSRAMSDQECRAPCNRPNYHPPRRRANSSPNCATVVNREPSMPVTCQTNSTEGETCGNDMLGVHSSDPPLGKQSAGTEELGDLFRNFKERKATKSTSRRRRRRRRPRNNPGHILEHETGKEGLGVGDPETDCRETTL